MFESGSLFDYARVVELADTPDLGSGALRREGSSPFPGNFLEGFFVLTYLVVW